MGKHKKKKREYYISYEDRVIAPRKEVIVEVEAEIKENLQKIALEYQAPID
jgi:hypothetical protein